MSSETGQDQAKRSHAHTLASVDDMLRAELAEMQRMRREGAPEDVPKWTSSILSLLRLSARVALASGGRVDPEQLVPIPDDVEATLRDARPDYDVDLTS